MVSARTLATSTREGPSARGAGKDGPATRVVTVAAAAVVSPAPRPPTRPIRAAIRSCALGAPPPAAGAIRRLGSAGCTVTGRAGAAATAGAGGATRFTAAFTHGDPPRARAPATTRAAPAKGGAIGGGVGRVGTEAVIATTSGDGVTEVASRIPAPGTVSTGGTVFSLGPTLTDSGSARAPSCAEGLRK